MGNGLHAGTKMIKRRRAAHVCVGISALSFLIAALSAAAPAGQPVEESRKALDLLLAARYSEFSDTLQFVGVGMTGLRPNFRIASPER